MLALRRPAAITVLLAVSLANGASAASVLFIGNSFTFGEGSPVHFYRAESVTDLNGEGIGGVPALFKSFTAQAGLHDDVYVETHPGVGLDWHLDHKRDVLGQRGWDTVVMHGFSLLDARKPGDPALLIKTAARMAALLRAKNPEVELRLTETWPRADATYEAKGAYVGRPIEAMQEDLHKGYALAAAAIPGGKVRVAGVGDAWVRAMHSGLADSNPYDGIEANKLDLWTYDHYHASTFGYYLEALVVFGSVTGLDPRSLGANECSGFELGLSGSQIGALEQVAYEQLAADGAVQATSTLSTPGRTRCASAARP
jgi:hypothetical protein